MRHVLSAVLAGAVLAGGASAACAQAAAPASSPAPSTAAAPLSTASAKDTDALINEWLNGPSAAVDTTAGGPPPVEPLRDKAIHGEVGVAVGNHGYREAYGVANIPLGEHADATVAIDQAQGQFWGHNYNQRTFGLDLAIGAHAGAPPPEGVDCAALKSGRRYVEPVWVTRMREQQPGGLAAVCPGAGPQG